jgi:hypothetical protein
MKAVSFSHDQLLGRCWGAFLGYRSTLCVHVCVFVCTLSVLLSVLPAILSLHQYVCPPESTALCTSPLTSVLPHSYTNMLKTERARADFRKSAMAVSFYRWNNLYN